MKLKFLGLIGMIFVSTQCASISSTQKADIAEWKGEGVYVEEKNPTTAMALNILPGIGDFYNGNVGLGVVNLLFWPLSILWAPIGGHDGALLRNWEETTIKIKSNERKEKAKEEKEEKKKKKKKKKDDDDD